jgi:hypothetical protein
MDEVVCDWSPEQRSEAEQRARAHALQFDRANVFDRLFALTHPTAVPVA